jgi:hypothetical protein
MWKTGINAYGFRVGARSIGKSNTNNLPAPTDLNENPYGEKNLFLKMQLKNRPPCYVSELQ